MNELCHAEQREELLDLERHQPVQHETKLCKSKKFQEKSFRKLYVAFPFWVRSISSVQLKGFVAIHASDWIQNRYTLV